MLVPVAVVTLILLPLFVLAMILTWTQRLAAGLARDLEESGETVLIPPRRALFQGGGEYASLKIEGAIALTARHIIFRQPSGQDIEVAVPQIAGLGKNAWFAGHYRGGRDFLIVKHIDGSRIGFMVKEPDQWIRQITQVQRLQSKAS